MVEGSGARQVCPYARGERRTLTIRKLACEMADNGLLAPEVAAAVERVVGVKQQGVRAGNWLRREQASELLNAPDPATLKGKRASAAARLWAAPDGVALARGRPDRAARRSLGQ